MPPFVLVPPFPLPRISNDPHKYQKMPTMNPAWMVAVASRELHWEVDQKPIIGPNTRTIHIALQARYPVNPIVYHPVMMCQARNLSTYAETLYDEVYSVRQGLMDMWKDDAMHVLMKNSLNDIIKALTFAMKIATKLEDKAVISLRGATCEIASAKAVEEFDWVHGLFS